MNAGAAGAAEREQRLVVVRSRERLEHLRPLGRPLRVTGKLARDKQRAADVGERLERRLLPTRDRRHRLVETEQPFVDVAARDLGEPQLRERMQLEVRVARLHGHVEAPTRACAADAAGSAARSERASSSHPRSEPGATVASSRSARASHPFAAAAFPHTSAYSRDSHSAMRAARARSSRRRKPA